MKRPPFDSKFSRRHFIKLAGAAVALPHFIPARALGREDAPAPSKRITLGWVGCGNMGTSNANSFLALKDCQIVAACDVDKKHLQKAVQRVNDHYKNKDCKPYHDFRELIARTDIDVILLTTPDHWHELVAVEAAHAKKDIYGEKPLGRTIAEQQAMVKAVRDNQRIWQTGSWQRSVPNFRKAAEIVRNGLIGKVTRVEVGLPGEPKNSGNAATSMDVSEPPPELDFNMWTGPSQLMPYIQGRVHRNWRWNYNTGGGQLMDWIGHHCDIAHWGLDFDNNGPSVIEGHGDFPDKNAVWNVCTKYRIELQYPRDIKMVIAGGYKEIRSGVKWIGTDGWVWVDRGSFEASNDDWRDFKTLPDEMRKVKLYESNNHQKNFLDCVKSRRPTITPAETAHHSSIPGHLGLISMLTGRKLKWDAQSEKILDDSGASELLTRPFRSPWKMS